MRVPQTQVAIRVIQEEHDVLQAVIHGMLYLVRDIGKGEATPDLKIFRAMLYYIREYPEKIHHPKEDRFLFSRLSQRTDRVQAAINELESQHASGDTLVGELEHSLARYELVGSSAFAVFAEKVEEYAKFYTHHMRLEEDVILPEAVKELSPEDWKDINDAFAANSEAIASKEEKLELEKLFSLIVNISPPPIGVGPVPR